MNVQVDFIRCHPWRSPLRPAKAVLICSLQISGRVRFKSQALLDEDALLTCMAYVDLNPIRGKMVASAETSEYTSAYDRLLPCKKAGVSQQQEKTLEYAFTKKLLFGFIGDENEQSTQGIPFSLLDYIELVDWSGRIIIEDKRGAISSQRPRILSTLGLDNDT